MQRRPLLISELLDRGAKVAPNELIVTATAEGTRRDTYLEVRNRAHQLAYALRNIGINVGDRVATFMWNNVAHLEAYHAVVSMGAVLHTVNIRLSSSDIEYIINDAKGRVIIVDACLLPLLESLAGKLPYLERVVIVAEEGEEIPSSSLPNPVSYESFIAGHPTNYPWPEIDENLPLALCYTSGTTGSPKGVMYTHRSAYLHTITECMTDAIGLSTLDCVFGVVPMFHVMAWGIPWSSLMLGAKQVLPHRYTSPERLVELLETEKVTISAGVPTVWLTIMEYLDKTEKKYDLSTFKRLVCGGAATSEALIRWYLENLSVEVIQGWGMTETSPLVAISRRFSKRSELESSVDEQVKNVAKAGQILPGVEVDIFDEHYNKLPHDGESVGEIFVRGHWVCNEYYNQSAPEKFHDDWLITGDVGKMDSEEYLIITDRTKDLIKSGGEWISSVDLENHIANLDSVSQVCVVAAPHPKWGERPVALVVKKAGEELKVDDIRLYCERKFAVWQVPDDVLFVESLPVTGTFKFDKKAIRAQLQKKAYLLPELRERAAQDELAGQELAEEMFSFD